MKTRKFLSVILSLVMILTALPLTAVNSFAETSGDFEYSILSSGTASITKYNGTATELEIPSELDGYSVTSITGGAFRDCTSLTSITIPDSVAIIDGYTFYKCTSLESITIPDSVISIGANAFYNTAYYKNEANWEDGVLYIGRHLIEAKNTVSSDYTIKDGTLTIAGTAFIECELLESVAIPDSVTNIGDGAFSYCSSIKSIIIPDSVTIIRDGVFCGCTSLKSITISDSVTSIGDSTFYCCKSLENITIPNSVKSIGYQAFYSCYSLKSVTIPDSVTNIDEDAFGYCYENGMHHVKIDGFTIYGYTGTQAECYANDNEFNFFDLDNCKHSNTELRNEKAATCTKEGYTGDLYCVDCGALLEQGKAISKAEHTIVIDKAKEPTKTETGLTEGSHCSVCGKVIVEQQIIPAIGISEEPKLGDLDGDNEVAIKDAKWVLQSVANTRNLTAEQRLAADVNGDGDVTIVDAKWILQAVAGIRDLSKK